MDWDLSFARQQIARLAVATRANVILDGVCSGVTPQSVR